MSNEVDFFFSQPNSERLDKFLVSCLSELTRTHIQGLIKNGYVMVNNLTILKAGYSLEKGASIHVTLPLPKPSNLQAENIPLDIVFEDDNMLVVNKPAGMVVHPSAGHQSSTLINALLAHTPFLSQQMSKVRPGIVHRLDKDTSGLILIAKNEKSQVFLQEQFSSRKVEKYYFALVDSKPKTPVGRIEAPIYRDPSNRKKMTIAPGNKGRMAITEYSTVESFTHHTLLRVKILTGRTHQIRVQLASIHCPVVGDRVYGHKNPSLPISRQFLHAYQIKIQIPGNSQIQNFIAPLPEDLKFVLQKLNSKFLLEVGL